MFVGLMAHSLVDVAVSGLDHVEAALKVMDQPGRITRGMLDAEISGEQARLVRGLARTNAQLAYKTAGAKSKLESLPE
jgi:hypothetical protein